MESKTSLRQLFRHEARRPGSLGALVLQMTRAVVGLARARIKLASLEAHDIIAANADVQHMARPPLMSNLADLALVHRVSVVVNGVARWMPWRSDCLVRALAAQSWLAAQGLASEIVIGVDKPADSGLMAHAWLRCGNRTVTGGVVDQYTVILDADVQEESPADCRG
jgi:hypothetical protein